MKKRHPPLLLLIAAILILLLGLALTTVGLTDFFRSVKDMGEPPTRFWCLFLGLPAVGIGGALVLGESRQPFKRYHADLHLRC